MGHTAGGGRAGSRPAGNRRVSALGSSGGHWPWPATFAAPSDGGRGAPCAPAARARPAARAVLTTALLALLLLAPAAPAHSRSSSTQRIAGGSVATGEQAPWVVHVSYDAGYQCSGTILSPDTVITAGHCAFDSAGQRSPVASYVVAAGLSAVNGTTATFDQARSVTAVDVHPAYTYGAVLPDDVALLRLAMPLDLTTPRAQAIALASSVPADRRVAAYGFGSQGPGAQQDANLRRLDVTLRPSYLCGSANAIVLCGSSAAGSTCVGDSGGPLVAPTNPPTLVGVIYSGTPSCGAGNMSQYTNLTAPEIGDWVRGNPAPPSAPRRDPHNPASLNGTPIQGATLTCNPGGWSNGPSFTYAFVDEISGEVLQDGAHQTIELGPGAVGRRLACRVSASNAGGTGQGLGASSGPVSPPQDPRLGITILAGHYGYSAAGPAQVRLVITDQAGREVRRVPFSMSDPSKPDRTSLPAGVYNVCLESDAQGIYSPGRACAKDVHHGRAASLVGVLTRSRAGARFNVSLTVQRALVGKRARINWRLARCTTCPATRLVAGGTVTLRPRTTLRSPPLRRGTHLRLVLRLPSTRDGEVRYAAAIANWAIGRR